MGAYSKGKNDAHRETLTKMKLDRGCIDCGFNADPLLLEWDHVPGRGPKLFQLSSLGNRGWKSIWAEIQKCEVRCRSCHREQTADRGREKCATDCKCRRHRRARTPAW